MPALGGRLEVARLRARLDETFTRVEQIDPDALELRSDFARYLCVLVSGYFEQAVQELAIKWCKDQASDSVARYASRRLRSLQNVNTRRLQQTLEDFDAGWSDRLSNELGEELDALDSLYGNRHQIAHGASVGLTYAQMRDYYEHVQRIVDFLVAQMDPP